MLQTDLLLHSAHILLIINNKHDLLEQRIAIGHRISGKWWHHHRGSIGGSIGENIRGSINSSIGSSIGGGREGKTWIV
jgi:hypothetical protein